MPRENQSTITEWGLQTFGVSDTLAKATRMNIEVAELVSAAFHDRLTEVVAELPDVQIVLYQVAESLGLDAAKEGLSFLISVEQNQRRGAAMLQLASAMLINDLRSENTGNVVSAIQIGRIQAFLWAMASGLHVELSGLVDKKMEINRARVWKQTGAGRFQHVVDDGSVNVRGG